MCMQIYVCTSGLYIAFPCFFKSTKVIPNAVKTEKPKRKNPKENLSYTPLEYKNSPQTKTPKLYKYLLENKEKETLAILPGNQLLLSNGS